MSYESVKTALWLGWFGLVLLSISRATGMAVAIAEGRAGSAALQGAALVASLGMAWFVVSVWWWWRQIASEAKRARR